MTKYIFGLATLFTQLAVTPQSLLAETHTGKNSSVQFSADSQVVGTIVNRLNATKEVETITLTASLQDSLKVGSAGAIGRSSSNTNSTEESHSHGGIYISVGAVIIILLLLIIIF